MFTFGVPKKREEESDGDNSDTNDIELANVSPPAKLLESSESTTVKVFHQQIEELERLKLTQKTLASGLLALERQTETNHVHLTLRSSSGLLLFNGLILPKRSRIKDLHDEKEKEGEEATPSTGAKKCKAKIGVFVRSEEKKKYEEEHCIISFQEEADKERFIKEVKKAIEEGRKPAAEGDQIDKWKGLDGSGTLA